MSLFATPTMRGAPLGLRLGRARRGEAAGVRGGPGTADPLELRVVAAAGAAGIVTLPVLLIASIALSAPIAAPAAIAVGYLGAAHALTGSKPRRASIWNTVVLGGLLAWALLTFLVSGGRPSSPGLASMLIAALFALGPEIARRSIGPRNEAGRAAALDSVACLDRLAPGEAVLIVDQTGTILAATAAAEEWLKLGKGPAGQDASRGFHLLDRASLLEALRRCRDTGAPARVALRPAFGPLEDARGEAEINEAGHGTFAIRMKAAPAEGRTAEHAVAKAAAGCTAEALPIVPIQPAPSQCELGEAVTFAVRSSETRAAARGLRIASECAQNVSAACDQRTARRLAAMLLDVAVAGARRGSEVQISVGHTTGAALMLLNYNPVDKTKEAESAEPAALRAARDAADAVGGAVLFRRGGDGSATIRLALPIAAMADGRQTVQRGAD